MHLRIPPSWHLPESACTPESIYHNRRHFLKKLGFSAAGLAGASLLPSSLRATTAGFPTKVNPDYRDPALKPTAYDWITSYNNFYEFGTDKADPKPNSAKWNPEPWTVEITGLINNPLKIDANDLVTKMGGAEQRVYRFRCVEAWSMVIPWDGFPLAKLIKLADPKPEAKFVTFTTLHDPKVMPGQRSRAALDWPYFEGLRLDEAMHDLSFIATGIYGRPIPNQNGAPLRLVVPWKYGFKYGKSIVKIDFVAKQPRNTWQVMAPHEYGFYANVNPTVDHPRWSQASERVIGEGGALGRRQKTLLFNGYEKEVAALYKGLDLRKNY